MIPHREMPDHLCDLEDVAGLDLVAVPGNRRFPLPSSSISPAVSVAEIVQHRLADHATHPDGLGAVRRDVQQEVRERDVDGEVLMLLAEHDMGLATCDDPAPWCG